MLAPAYPTGPGVSRIAAPKQHRAHAHLLHQGWASWTGRSLGLGQGYTLFGDVTVPQTKANQGSAPWCGEGTKPWAMRRLRCALLHADLCPHRSTWHSSALNCVLLSCTPGDLGNLVHRP